MGEQFSLLGNHVSRWGRQALLLDSSESRRWFQGTNLEDPLTVKRLLVPSAIGLSNNGTNLGIDSLEAYRQAITRLSWLSYSRSRAYLDTRGCHSPARSIAGLAAPHAGRR